MADEHLDRYQSLGVRWSLLTVVAVVESRTQLEYLLWLFEHRVQDVDWGMMIACSAQACALEQKSDVLQQGHCCLNEL